MAPFPVPRRPDFIDRVELRPSRRFRRRFDLILWAVTAGAVPVCGAEVPAQVESPHSVVRLLDGGSRPGEGMRAGVEIRLDAGFITYWRSPREAGVPPVFDFSGSSNVKDVRIDYPAPRLIDEDGMQAYGYEGGVTFPAVVVPAEASAPVRLDLVLDYAVCSKLCLPAKAHVSITLGTPAPADSASLRAAEAKVPEAAGLGGAGPVRIDAVTWIGANSIAVEAVTPDGTGTLFAEAPDPWYFSASPARLRAGGHVAFVLTGPDHPPTGPLPAEPLRLTLVAPSGSITVPVRLDAVSAKP